MKRNPALVVIAALVAVACGKTASDPNTIGGDANVPAGVVGSTISTSSDIPAQMTITSNGGGIATVHVTADIASIPGLKKYYDLMPASMKSGANALAFDTTMKVTAEGYQDTFNKDRALHTIVKFDAAVGDKYVLTKSDGVKITRTVTQVSTTDDFPYGFFLIKVIKVEQDSRVPGVKAFRFYANHRFGIVQFEIVNDDDSVVRFPIYHSNLN
jgi:hypothetical protein